MNDLYFVKGGNTWFAEGPLTAESKAALSKLWAVVPDAKQPLHRSHVLGDFGTTPTADVIVDGAFAKAMQDLEPKLFDFTPHDRVWDKQRNCPPWEGPSFIATLLPHIPSYDLATSAIMPREKVKEKYRGAYSSSGGPKFVRASTVAGRLVWRDTYMRHVLCTQSFLDRLKDLGVAEWTGMAVGVIEDLN